MRELFAFQDVMSFPGIPSRLDEWNIDVLNKLLLLRDIESDAFDFKGVDFGDLSVHLCAMANNSGGILVLGIDENKTPDGHLLGFKKTGFDTGKEDSVANKIGNNVFQVEPHPKVGVRHIQDIDGRFYTILQVVSEESKKPFMLRDKGQFYVRINGSSRPASRAIVLNLFTNLTQKRSEVYRLQTSFNQFKEALLFLTRQIDRTDHNTTAMLPPIDVTFVRNAAIAAEWFLVGNNSLGKNPKTGYEFGFIQVMHNIAILNTFIDGFNNSETGIDKETILSNIKKDWLSGGEMTTQTVDHLDKVIKQAEEFLSERK